MKPENSVGHCELSFAQLSVLLKYIGDIRIADVAENDITDLKLAQKELKSTLKELAELHAGDEA